RVRPHVAARGDNELAQNNEPAKTLEPSAKVNFLASEQFFVEPARGEKGTARAEHEASGGQPGTVLDQWQQALQHNSVQRQAGSAEAHAAATARRTFRQRPNRSPQYRLGNLRVGVDENELVAGGRLCPGISRRCDLAATDRNHPGAVRPRDFI